MMSGSMKPRTTIRALTLGVTLLAVLATSGCNPFRRNSAAPELCKAPEGYAEAAEAPTLRVPTGLQAPDTRNALRIPDLTTPPPPARTKEQGCLDQPPPYTVAKPAEPEA
jgi:uncharacterized lipoprotein